MSTFLICFTVSFNKNIPRRTRAGRKQLQTRPSKNVRHKWFGARLGPRRTKRDQKSVQKRDPFQPRPSNSVRMHAF
jgi:hypothetical protein